jgi:hypothetical protein
MSDIIIKIMVEVLSILSLATKEIKEGRLSMWFFIRTIVTIYLDCDIVIGKFVRKLLGESKIEDALQRLDRLTLDEAHMTGTETLQVVHHLKSDMKLIVGGTHTLLFLLLMVHYTAQIDGTTSEHDTRQPPSMYSLLSLFVRLSKYISSNARGNEKNG